MVAAGASVLSRPPIPVLAMPAPHQPIVILGGFLITQEAYQPMRHCLAVRSGQPLERVELVSVGRLEWLLTVWPSAWARILDRVALAVERQARLSPTGRVTLVGHSSGGIMLRLFLDDQPFEGRRWNGRALVDTMVMLGSPHTALKATPLRQRVARQLQHDEVLFGELAVGAAGEAVLVGAIELVAEIQGGQSFRVRCQRFGAAHDGGEIGAAGGEIGP